MDKFAVRGAALVSAVAASTPGARPPQAGDGPTTRPVTAPAPPWPPGTTPATFTYNDANQILTRNGTTGFAYDANGNETAALSGTSTAGTSRTSTWNKRNQLTSPTVAGQPALPFTYRGASQDTRLSAGPTSYRNTALGLTAQNNGTIATTEASTSTWIRTPDGTLVAQRTGTASSGTSHYYFFDNLGSVIGLVNSTGTKVNSYSYDPYGISRTKTETIANPWQYTGGYLDTATGLYKLGIRYYDPTLGRFTQPDPTGQDPHYTYAGNSPASFNDPTGGFAVGVGVSACVGVAFQVCVAASFNFLTGRVSGQVQGGLGYGANASVSFVVGGDTPPVFSYLTACIGIVSVTVYVPLRGRGFPQVQVGACAGQNIGVGQGVST